MATRSASPVGGGNPDAAFNTTLLTMVPPDTPVPMSVIVPPPSPLLQPGNVWPAATHLVVGDDGRLQQSAQSSEICNCVSMVIRRANSNIFFVNAFPNLQTQNEWLGQSLTTVLQDQAQMDLIVHEVNLRAQQDSRYMTSLISMVQCQAVYPLTSVVLNPLR